jgi:hypothetical protein
VHGRGEDDFLRSRVPCLCPRIPAPYDSQGRKLAEVFGIDAIERLAVRGGDEPGRRIPVEAVETAAPVCEQEEEGTKIPAKCTVSSSECLINLLETMI